MSWIMLIVGSLAAGSALVALMIVPRKGILVLAPTVMGGIIVSFAGLFAISMESGRLAVSAVSALIGMLLFGLGYSVATAAAPRLLAGRSPQELDVSAFRSECAAVILSTCIEPTTYSPRAFADVLAELDDTQVPLPAWSARPMLFAAERSRYRAAGGTSPGRGMCEQIAADLEGLLADDDRCYVAGTAWCTRRPSLADGVARAVADGADHVIVVQFSIAASRRADRARSAVDILEPRRHGIRVVYTPPLWGSRVVVDDVVGRIVTAMTDRAPSSVGICLVGHGQPSEWHAEHPTWTEHETYFHQRVRAHLEDHGVPPENVKLAWLDWAEPDVTETVRHLAALGSRLVIVVPASMPVETLSTTVDLRQAAALARVPETVELAVLEAWGPRDAITVELAARVRALLDDA